jgi:hypothetical protein
MVKTIKLLVADCSVRPGTFDVSRFKGSVDRGPLKGGHHSFSEPESSNFLLKGVDYHATGSRVS